MVGIPGGPLCFRGAPAACVGWLVCGTGVTGGAGAPQFHQSKRHRHQFRNPTGACVPDSFPPDTSLMILMQFSRFSKFPRPRWFVLSPEEPLPAPQCPCLSPLPAGAPQGRPISLPQKQGTRPAVPLLSHPLSLEDLRWYEEELQRHRGGGSVQGWPLPRRQRVAAAWGQQGQQGR